MGSVRVKLRQSAASSAADASLTRKNMKFYRQGRVQ
jgi:hypothetical protein